jgi:hypothetical protein
MTDILTLGCFVAGFIIAWLLRTGYVMAKISWAQEQMESKVRYWQGEALHARAVADHLLRQLEASTGQSSGPPDRPDIDTDRPRPDKKSHG